MNEQCIFSRDVVCSLFDSLMSDDNKRDTMIIAITGSDASLSATIADYLEQRSFYRIDLSDAKRLPTPDDITPGRHHLITGGDLFAIKTLLDNHPDAKLLFAGTPEGLPPDQAALYQLAHAHVTQNTPESDIRTFVVAAMSSMPRPSWDQYFIDIAQVVARRGNCMKRQIAAVLVRDNRIVATGYNGTPKGAINCNEGGCERCNSLAPSGTGLDDCVCNHAEENAICQAAYHGISIKDATLYCTHSPCLRCAKLLINAGIKEVVYNADYPLSNRSIALLEQCHVTIRKYP